MDLFRQVFRVHFLPFLVIGLIATQHSRAYFEVSKGRYNWVKTNIECIPAAPHISPSPTVYKVEDLGINITEGEEVWVGYFQVVRVFEYIGCVSQKQLLSILPQLNHVEISGDPGHCFPKCQENTIVAVTKSRCYCLGTEWTAEIDMKSTKCTDQCKYPGVACGRLHTSEMYSYLSVYKINPRVDHSTIKNLNAPSGKPNCLCLDSAFKYYWEYCSMSLLIMCNNGNRSNDRKLYGYLSKANDGKLVVKFSSHDSRKRVLCVKDGKTSGMTTTERRVLTSTASWSETATDPDVNESRAYIPIATSAAAAVTIGAIIVSLIVFVKRRRQRVTNECKHNNDGTPHDAENENSCPELTAPDCTENSYNYVILQPHTKDEGTNNLPRDSADSNIYNDTALNRKYEQRRTEHVYNHLDTGNDNTYDHAVEQNVKNAVDSSNTCLDDIYDSTISEEIPKALMHTDNIYNKTEDSAENVYNCLAGNQNRTKTATDNIYGMRDKKFKLF